MFSEEEKKLKTGEIDLLRKYLFHIENIAIGAIKHDEYE